MHNIIHNKSAWHNEYYHLHVDVSSGLEFSSIVKGWFVNKSDDDYAIRIIDQTGDFIDAIEYSKVRPKLAELYPDIENVTRSGFEVDTKAFCPDKEYIITIFKGEEELINVLSFVNKSPLLYVHIAKTAGSTVNKVLNEWFGNDRSLIHAESKNNWKELVKQQKIDFLSGHIPYKAFVKASEFQGYKKAITFREPYSHITSHIAWIRALSLEENRKRYEAHPEYIQRLSDKLARYDLSYPIQISELIESFNSLEHRLLDNTQTRYIRTELAKQVVDASDFISAIENLKEFDFVGTDNNISGFLAEIAVDYGFEYKNEDRRENVLNNKFGLDIDNPDIREALFPLIKFDIELYKNI